VGLVAFVRAVTASPRFSQFSHFCRRRRLREVEHAVLTEANER
jgi:hypothetical protein